MDDWMSADDCYAPPIWDEGGGWFTPTQFKETKTYIWNRWYGDDFKGGRHGRNRNGKRRGSLSGCPRHFLGKPLVSKWVTSTIPTARGTSVVLGEDEEEKYTGVDELFMNAQETEDQLPKYGPRVEISKEKHLSLFKKWRCALILKLLGKTVSYNLFSYYSIT